MIVITCTLNFISFDIHKPTQNFLF